ncbi:TPA: hypothetical protein I7243_21575 [Vibrio vulnificus]|nr:hypothetical protein [Vibrio vulnificus]HDY8039416.1 hypothetical protein [Vibrio vulnificus]HDY8173855.1 hypothetical protein [Vibrio vulnificus]
MVSKEQVEDFFAERNHTLHTLTGTVFLSLGCAFVSSYKHAEASKDLDIWAKKIAYLLTNPYLGIFIGILLLILGGFASHYRQKRQDKNIEKERKEKNEVQLKHFAAVNSLTSEKAKNENLLAEIREHKAAAEYLKEENSQLHDMQVSTWLKGLCKYIGMDCDSRVSIYFVNGESFNILARNSPNPLLGRFTPKTYKLENGVISLSWQYGEYIDNEIPKDPEEYIEYMQRKYGFNREHLDSIKMKSKFMYGIAIVDADVKIGVILFEGLERDSFDEKMTLAIKKYCEDFQSYLCGFVKESIRYREQANASKQPTKANEDSILQRLGGGK